MTYIKKFSAEQLNEFERIINKRRQYLYSEVQQLSDILQELTNSYRILVDAAEEFNRIAFASKDDVDDAVERADDLGSLIDDVIRVLTHKLKIYLKDIKRLNVYPEELLKYQCTDEVTLSENDFRYLQSYIIYNDSKES